MLVLVSLLGLYAGVASAVMAPPIEGRQAHPRMVDARVNLRESFEHASLARPGAAALGLQRASGDATTMAAALALRQTSRTKPGLEARYSNLTGGPRLVRSLDGPLTSAAPGRSSENIVRDFLSVNGDLYGLSRSDVDDLVVLGDSPGGASALRMLRLEQRIDGRAVFQSESRFLLDREGRLLHSVGLLVPHARAVAPNVDRAQLLPAPAALSRLMASLGKTLDPASFQSSAGPSGEILLEGNDPFISGPVTAREVLFPLGPGFLVPAWSLVVFTSGREDWYAVVDAETGDLLWRKNIRNYASAHDARFRVYVQADGTTPADSPAPQSPTLAVPGAGTQAPAIAPTIVRMQVAMDNIASPNGWIDDCPMGGCTANETQTLGNNVVACMDRTANLPLADSCDTDVASILDGNGRPTGNPDSAGRNRDFLGVAPRDFQTGFLPPPQAGNPEAGQTATGAGNNGTLAIDSFRRGMVTHLFYLSNWYHDKLYKLGFDEAAGNFQKTNFSGMGLGNDRVLADAQDSSGTNNANFSTPPDGTSGRMQMYRFTGPTIDRDGSLDAEIVLHELTHGTSNRLVGNAAGLNWDPAAGLGEGWSDFYALSLLNNTNADNPNGSYAAGAYATYKLGPAFLDNYVYGIRRFPYSTIRTVNPLTWADVDDVTNNLAGGIAADPLDANFNGGMEVHNIGEIWALTLWGVRSRIIADPSGANGSVPTGNQKTLQLVTDGLKMTPIDPTFTEARDAIVDADCATNACANEASIWAGFADRGLGYGASTPYRAATAFFSSHMAVKESFSVPFLDVKNVATDVTINDSAPNNNNGVIDPGEAIKLTVKLTNPWRAAGKAVTSATATLTTSTPGITIYDNAATYGAIAPQAAVAGDTFMFTVAPSVPCGGVIDFTLTTVSNLGTTATTFQLRVGAASGTNPVVTYTGNPSPDLAIPDEAPRGVKHQININDDFVIADLDFRIDSITHTWTGDLTAMLRSPGGLGVDLVSLIGVVANPSGGSSGGNITNMVIDDDLPVSAANDMGQVLPSAAPYTRSWLPIFNSPWTTTQGFPSADPVGNLSRYNGSSTKGTWSILVSDQAPPDTGTLNAWSILVTPVKFVCAAVVPTVNIGGTKTVTGTFKVGGTVTYTVNLTNAGTANQADNPGNEFTDVLPAGLTLVSATATSGTALATIGTNTVTWNGALAPLGGNVTITITATVNAGTSGSTISNQGSIAFDADANGSNEASALTDDPGVAGSANPTNFKVVAPPTIAKTFGNPNLVSGGTTTLTFTIANPAGNPVALTGVAFSDTLPGGLVVASPNGLAGSCGGGAISAVAGSGTVSLSGATLAPSTNCVFSVKVTGTTAGVKNNTTDPVTSTNGGTGLASNTATVTVSFATLDIDASIASTIYDALTDGMLVIRYLQGVTGAALTNGVMGSAATRPANQIEPQLIGMRAALDVDGDGNFDAQTDGVLIIRYLLGLRGSALIQGALGVNATRTTVVDIEAFLAALTP